MLKLKLVVLMVVGFASAHALGEAKQPAPKEKTVSELTWLKNPELRFDDLTPEGLKQKATLVDFVGPHLVYSEYRLTREESAKGCRGKGLYFIGPTTRGAAPRKIQSPLLECVVNLKVVAGTLYIQTREEAGDRLLTIGKDLTDKSLSIALADNFDGENSHLASARRKFKLDLLRKAGAIAAKRSAPARLLLSLNERRVDVLWLINDQRKYVCLSDSFSLPEGIPSALEPTRVACKAQTSRQAHDFVSFPQAGLFIFWQGTREAMGRIEQIVGEQSTVIGSESVVDPLNWVKVSAKDFAIHYAGNVAVSSGGFYNFETGNLNFDEPFVYFFELATQSFHRVPFLSGSKYQVLWIREKDNGILVSMINTDSDKPKVIFVSPTAQGETVDNL